MTSALSMKRACLLLSVLLIAVVGNPAVAKIVNLGGGWQAEWAPSLDATVDMTSYGVIGDALVIQKSAEFTQAPQGGVFPTIPIVFRQIDASAVSKIAIDDEIITNSTGVDWTDFHMQLLDGIDVAFDPAATLGSGGPGPIGWTIDPFTQAAFSQDNMALDIWGGVVPDQTSWFPGNGLTNGQLLINVVPKDGITEPFTVFTLKETPTPEPASLILLAMGGLAVLRRR